MASDLKDTRTSKYFKEYNDLGVRFVYPNNWFVQTQTWDKGVYGISVDSPDGSFWSLAIYPKGIDLDAAAKNIVETMNAEYDQLERSEIKRYVADRVLTGYEINFFYLDMTSTATALKFEDDRRAYVIFYQTVDRLALTDEELSRTDVFDAMTHTLVSNLTDQDVDYWDEEDDEFRFGAAFDEKKLREEENREYFRRKYRNARATLEETEWRDGLEGIDLEDENDDERRRAAYSGDERLEDFLRAVDEDYGLDRKRSEEDDAEESACDEYGRVARYPDYDEYVSESDDEDDDDSEDLFDGDDEFDDEDEYLEDDEEETSR